jgi:indole-3-glycerol phosphate synthase
MKDARSSNSSNTHTNNNSNNNNKLQSLLMKRKGTISIIAEYKRKLSGSGFLSEVPPPELLSPIFREFGASAIAVLADERTGGCTYADISTFVTEQSNASDEVPGPVPIISNDIIVDEIQIAQAKEAGAIAITINYSLLQNETMVSQFIQDAKTIHMESIVIVSTPQETQSAINAGATMVCVSGSIMGAVPKYDVVSNITTTSSTSSSTSAAPPICIIANILAQNNKALEEVEESWSCRDLGFHCVWISDALYKSGNDPVEHPGAIIQSMRLKSSVQFASPKARSGKGEGAREYLGDILM